MTEFSEEPEGCKIKCVDNHVEIDGICIYKCEKEYMNVNANGQCVCPAGTVWNDFDQDCREVITIPTDIECQFYNVAEGVCLTDEQRFLILEEK